MGIFTVGIATTPFPLEGRVFEVQAQKGLASLRDNVDSLIVIPNSKADYILCQVVRGICDIITVCRLPLIVSYACSMH